MTERHVIRFEGEREGGVGGRVVKIRRGSWRRDEGGGQTDNESEGGREVEGRRRDGSSSQVEDKWVGSPRGERGMNWAEAGQKGSRKLGRARKSEAQDDMAAYKKRQGVKARE